MAACRAACRCAPMALAVAVAAVAAGRVDGGHRLARCDDLLGAVLFPRQLGPGVPLHGNAKQPSQPRTGIRPLARIRDEPVQPISQLRRRSLGRVFLGDAQPLPDDLGQRPERHPLAVGQAPAPVPPHRLRHAVDVGCRESLLLDWPRAGRSRRAPARPASRLRVSVWHVMTRRGAGRQVRGGPVRDLAGLLLPSCFRDEVLPLWVSWPGPRETPGCGWCATGRKAEEP